MEAPYAIWDKLCEQSFKSVHENRWNPDSTDRDDQQIVALCRLEADMYNGGYR